MKQLYEIILPTQGTYCVSGIATTGKITNRFAETTEELYKIIKELKDARQNVFVAPNSFNGFSRKADNAVYSKSFFVDLDVGEGDKKYATKGDALKALDNFISDKDLPPPFVIDSGGGVHAYWPFDSNVAIPEWKVYAHKFKALCLDSGLKIDPAVTADASRIMRCPDTFNYKSGTPRPTSILQALPDELRGYDFELFKDFLGREETPSDLKTILDQVPKGFDEDIFDPTKFDNYEYSFEKIIERTAAGEGCAQVANLLLNSAAIPEPLWRAGLSVAVRCLDGDEAIHRMSEEYDGYDPEETERKARETLTAKWAYSCKKFDDLNPGLCTACRHYGKIYSPLTLGERLKEVQVPAAPALTPADQEFADYLSVFQKKKLLPFTRGANGGIYYQPPTVTNKDGTTTTPRPTLVTRYDFYPIQRMYSKQDGECLLMKVRLPNDASREFLFPLSAARSLDETKKIIYKMGIVTEEDSGKIVKYITAWSNYLIATNSAAVMRTQMGWSEDFSGFAVGATEYMRDGSTIQTSAAPNIRNVAPLLVPTGDYERWKAAAREICKPGMEPAAFALLCAFGSPLMSRTSTPGVTVCLKGETGVGKSGALYAALSLFGHGRDLSVMEGNATENTLIGRYLIYKNLLFGLDEVQNISPTALANTVHRVSQGKPKLRMQSSVNAERELEAAASLIMLMTSNRDLTEIMAKVRANPDAENARFVQIDVKKPQPLIDDPEMGQRVFDTFRHHYGHAGPEYVRYLFEVGEDYIKETIAVWTKEFSKLFGRDTAFRFYENLVGVTMAGGQLANEAGITEFDLQSLFRWTIQSMLSMQAEVKSNTVDYEEVLNNFIMAHQANFLTVNEARVIIEPRGQLLGRNEVHSQTRFISKSALRVYLAENNIPTRQFELNMVQKGVITKIFKKRLGTGWPHGADIGAVTVYEIPAQIPEEVLDNDGSTGP